MQIYHFANDLTTHKSMRGHNNATATNPSTSIFSICWSLLIFVVKSLLKNSVQDQYHAPPYATVNVPPSNYASGMNVSHRSQYSAPPTATLTPDSLQIDWSKEHAFTFQFECKLSRFSSSSQFLLFSFIVISAQDLLEILDILHSSTTTTTILKKFQK